MSFDGTLQVTTPSDRELVMTRQFNAPRALVFEAITVPELIKRWYGPRGWTMTLCEVDLRVGGKWHYVSRDEKGREMSQRGVYREIVKPSRIVNTETWDDWNPGEVLATATLAEADSVTTFTCTLLFPTQEVRDMLIKSGMARGAGETYDKLAEYLSSAATTV